MKINYDREEDILIIETLPFERIDHAEHVGPFISHFTTDNRLVILEVLDASEFLSQVIKLTLRREKEEIPFT